MTATVWATLTGVLLVVLTAGVVAGHKHPVADSSLAPSPGWECEVCELVIEGLVPIIIVNDSITVTEFHREAAALCEVFFPGEPWLVGYCQFIVDKNGLELYEIVVKRQQPHLACTILGYCNNKDSTHAEQNRPQEQKQRKQENGRSFDVQEPKGDEDWAFVVISDIHVGQDTDDAPWMDQIAIEKVNNLTAVENIKMVFITGDITDSAMSYQWSRAKKLLSQLKAPYIPILGNHDIWSYNATYEEPQPTGDFQFAETFSDILKDPRIPSSSFYYNTKPSFNKDHNITSWFQNWELQYKNFVFYGLDWISRAHALRELGYKGGWPGASIQNFPEGTFPWLQQRLELLKDDNRTVIFLQHHPFGMPIFVPEIIYSFPYYDKIQILRTQLTVGQPSKYWGVIAGHLHIWYDGPAWDVTNQRQWLTEATKEASSFTLVRVRNGNIASLTKLFGYDS